MIQHTSTLTEHAEKFDSVLSPKTCKRHPSARLRACRTKSCAHVPLHEFGSPPSRPRPRPRISAKPRTRRRTRTRSQAIHTIKHVLGNTPLTRCGLTPPPKSPPRQTSLSAQHFRSMPTESDSPLDQLWNEYGQVFREFDDLTLARWLAQTLGQLSGKAWRWP